MKMKINALYSVCAAAVALFTASCSQDDFLGDTSAEQEALTINVFDGGYASDAPGRASESGYATVFTSGDACGLYCVRNGMAVISNQKLIATEVDGRVQWKTADGSDIYSEETGDKYFIYYPYRENMEGKTDASASDDAGFFASLIEEWQPLEDQSDYVSGYTESDLMTATGALSGSNLSFGMKHQMGLLVIELPDMVYQFVNYEVPDYTGVSILELPDEREAYCKEEGIYRYLINPASSDLAQINCSYDGGNRRFSITPSVLPGHYTTYNIDGGRDEKHETTYRLQAGDFFCSNSDASGWYIIPKDLAPTEADNCIGVVFRTGKDDSDKSDYSTTIGDTFHGYVVALTDAGKYQWGPYGSLAGTINSSSDWNGYYNQRILTEKGLENYPAAQACANYTGKSERESAPVGSSGWFLPSCGQVKSLHPYFEDRNSTVRTSIISAGGNVMSTAWGTWYWSSSEDSGSGAWYVDFGSGNTSLNYKSSTRDVRAVLAF